MKIPYLLIAVAWGLSASPAGELIVTGSTTRNDLFHASVDGNASPVQARELAVTARYSDGQDIPKTLIVLFEPQSRFYLWALTGAPHKRTDIGQLAFKAPRSAVALGNGRMVWFVMGQPGFGLVESSRHAWNLDDACQRSLSEASLQLPVPETYASTGFIHLEIGKQLGAISRAAHADFFAPTNRVEFGAFPTYIHAMYTGGNWEVTIEANLRAKVILSNRYDVLSIEQIPGEGVAAAFGQEIDRVRDKNVLASTTNPVFGS